VNFNYFISDPVFEYIVRAVRLIADHGWALLPQYRFDALTGRWHHRDGAVEPPLRLSMLNYSESGELTYPIHRDIAPEGALADHLDSAHTLLHALPAPELLSGESGFSADFDQLRWFDLPVR
jgi:hypothetical protein